MGVLSAGVTDRLRQAPGAAALGRGPELRRSEGDDHSQAGEMRLGPGAAAVQG